MTDVAGTAHTPRAEHTRAAITEAALALFRERGYEAATMRAIAQRAGVSTGNAYYYFSSKEELIQEFYARNHADHLAASRTVLAAETDLAARLAGTVRAHKSDACSRTYRLIDATVPVIAQLVAASRLPALRRTLRDLLAVVDQLSA